MSEPDEVVFLLDVDNTLLDNDHLIADLDAHLLENLGDQQRQLYWKLFEDLRTELGYVDYLAALQRYRREHKIVDRQLMMMSSFLLDYPFVERLFPHVPDTLAHLRRWGKMVIVSDGDIVFQPRKIQRSGLWDAVEGNVLIYEHKEKMLADIERHYPSRYYVMVDDKLSILTAMKTTWGKRLLTVFPRQGHYALDQKKIAGYPPADITIEAIGDLIDPDLPAYLRER